MLLVHVSHVLITPHVVERPVALAADVAAHGRRRREGLWWLTWVPLEDPRSTSQIPSGPTTMAAWHRLTLGSGNSMSLRGPRPTRFRPFSSGSYRPASGPALTTTKVADRVDD